MVVLMGRAITTGIITIMINIIIVIRPWIIVVIRPWSGT